MTYSDAPRSVRSLDQRIRNLEGDESLALRRRIGMAVVVVGQMLPEGAIKGGSAMALRYGRGTRFTQDLDAARVQPFDVRLTHEGRAWCTVKFEPGHNEIGDAEEPEHHLAEDLGRLFTEVGLEAPKSVPVMRVDHKVAQKLHAVSEPGSERARDLVDLQLLDKGEDLDLSQVRATCVRLFDYRRQQTWPPTIVAGEGWDTLYTVAAEDIDVLPVLEAAVAWTNDLVKTSRRKVRNRFTVAILRCSRPSQPSFRRPLDARHAQAPDG